MPGSTKSKKLSLVQSLRKIKGLKIKLRKREILRHLKYSPKSGEIPPETESLIQQELQRAYELMYPCVIYLTVPRSSDTFEKVKNEILKGSEKMEKISSNCVAVTLMASTAGIKIEKEIDNLKKKELTRALVLDAAGSEAAEQAVNFVSKLITEQAREEESCTGMRISPGYGGWDIRVTEKILKILDASKIGIKYTPSGIMTPRKSVAAVQGWFKQ